MPQESIGWASLSASGVAVSGPCLLWGITSYSTGSSETVSVYDGQDPGAGRLIMTLGLERRVSRSVMFPKPLRIDNGIYVSLGAGVDQVTVAWEGRK